MIIWGLSLPDFLILIGFLIVILVIGIYASRSVKGESDFYLGGRKMGKALQFFLNFGNATDTNDAVTMAQQVFNDGVAGMWLQLQTLFYSVLLVYAAVVSPRRASSRWPIFSSTDSIPSLALPPPTRFST